MASCTSYRPHLKDGEGNVVSVHRGGGGTYPGQVQIGGYPKVPTPPPPARSGRGRRYPKVPTPPTPARSGWEDGYPKVLAPPHPGQGLATGRAVCLLRSRRRTFLVCNYFTSMYSPNVSMASCTSLWSPAARIRSPGRTWRSSSRYPSLCTAAWVASSPSRTDFFGLPTHSENIPQLRERLNTCAQ